MPDVNDRAARFILQPRCLIAAVEDAHSILLQYRFSGAGGIAAKPLRKAT
jgi:hypothetical protein